MIGKNQKKMRKTKKIIRIKSEFDEEEEEEEEEQEPTLPLEKKRTKVVMNSNVASSVKSSQRTSNRNRRT